MTEAAGDAAPGERRGTLARQQDLAYWAIFVIALAAFFVRLRTRSLTFPVPWPDEGSFLWQALAFRDTGSLFAPELNPLREVLWMPPGFMVLEGTIFRVVPFSLERARFLSALFLSGAWLALAALARPFRARMGHAVLAAIFLHACPTFLLVANVARMETLVLLLGAGGFWLAGAGRLLGVVVLLFAPLVHPNGLFALAAGVPFFLFAGGKVRPARAEWVALAVALLAWAGYGAYVASHWQDFLTDIGNQIRFKNLISAEKGGTWSRLLEPVVLGPLVLLLVAAPVAFLRGVVALGDDARRVRAALVLSAALLAQTANAAGWLYEAYTAFAALLAAVVFVEVAWRFADARPWSTQLRTVCRAAVLGLTAAGGIAVCQSPFITRSLDRAVVIRSEATPVYITEDDREAVRRFLRASRPSQGKLIIQFLPDSDALIFEDLRHSSLRFVQQTFYETRSHIAIVHESIWFPKWIRDLQLIKMHFMHGRRARETMIRARDGTERWVVYDWRLPPASP